MISLLPTETSSHADPPRCSNSLRSDSGNRGRIRAGTVRAGPASRPDHGPVTPGETLPLTACGVYSAGLPSLRLPVFLHYIYMHIQIGLLSTYYTPGMVPEI